MQKPLNPMTLAIWGCALLAVANLVWFVWNGNAVDIFVLVTRGIASAIGPLVGLGVLIELVDQIRWNALPPEQRTPFRFKL